MTIADFVTPTGIALASRALRAVVGVFVAVLAYRGYRHNNAPMMRSLAIGIGILTAGVVSVVVVVDQAGGEDGAILLARGFVTVAGLCAILHAIVRQ
jgi:ABC-type Co2+ transport system permease subunit